jgi:hypothetical protein
MECRLKTDTKKGYGLNTIGFKWGLISEPYEPSVFLKCREFLDTTAREQFEWYSPPPPTNYMLKATIWNENKTYTAWLTCNEMLSYALPFVFTRSVSNFWILHSATHMQHFIGIWKSTILSHIYSGKNFKLASIILSLSLSNLSLFLLLPRGA